VRALLRFGQLAEQLSGGVSEHLRGNKRNAYNMLRGALDEAPGCASRAHMPGDAADSLMCPGYYFLGEVCRASSRNKEAARAYCAAIEIMERSANHDRVMWADSVQHAFGLLLSCTECAGVEKPPWMRIEGGALKTTAERLVDVSTAAIATTPAEDVEEDHAQRRLACAWSLLAYAFSEEGNQAESDRCMERSNAARVAPAAARLGLADGS